MRHRRLDTALLAALCALAQPNTAPAQQVDSERALLESRRRLEQIRRERGQLRDEMEGLRSRVHDLSTEMGNLDRQVTTSADLLRELDVQVGVRESQVSETQAEIASAEDHLARRKEILNRRVRGIYEHGPMHTVEVLLSARSFGELLNRYKYLYLIARHDRQLVRDVGALGEQLRERRRLLEHNLHELQDAQSERAAEHALLSGLEVEQQRSLSAAQLRQRDAERRIAQLERDEQRLGGLVASLERARRAAERRAAATPAAAPRSARSALPALERGSLPWPAAGRLLYGFGRQTQPNGTVLRWNGVGIGAAAGTPVVAVAPGEVVLAGPFEGYGPTVVISHGGGYYSLYLYLESLDVKKAQRVERGTRIGRVGGSGTPEGAHVEFQIRGPTGQPVDPMEWLRRAGTR